MPIPKEVISFTNKLENKMDTKETISKEIKTLCNEGAKIAQDLAEGRGKTDFHLEYQLWYTRAIRVVNVLAPDRYEEFKSYYEIDKKRKRLVPSNYVIQDLLNGISGLGYSAFDAYQRVSRCFMNQLAILRSMHERVDYILANIDDALLLRLQNAELKTAERLMKVSIRAAGALVGVVIENHLQKLIENHGITIRKQNPTINDLSEPLKNAGVFDIPTWRKIAYLADIRNICSHKKDAEPTKEQVTELIDGANWLIKNIV